RSLCPETRSGKTLYSAAHRTSRSKTGLDISPEQPDPMREHVLRPFGSLLRRSGDPYTEAFSSSPFNVGAWYFVIFAASAARGVEHYRPPLPNYERISADTERRRSSKSLR